MAEHRTALDHFVAGEAAAKADLARALEGMATNAACEAKAISERDHRPSTSSTRADIRELELALLAYDRAKAAADAARVAAGEDTIGC